MLVSWKIVFSSSLMILLFLLAIESVSITFLMSNLMENLNFFQFYLDLMSKLFLYVVSIIFACIMSWSVFYLKPSFNLNKFYFMLLLFILSMFMMLLSNNFLLLFVGWESLGILSVILVMFYNNWISICSGVITILMNRLGDSLMLMVISVIIVLKDKSVLMMLMLVILTFTKSAQWPFSSWLPAAMAAPTPVSALVHSSTLVTAGVWVTIRFCLNTLMNFKFWLMLGGITLILSSMSALLEMDVKKLVALSTLSQLGLMFISLAIGNKMCCFIHVVTHAFAKANLFILMGSLLYKAYADQDARMLNVFNSLAVITMITSLTSLTGLIFTSGFLSKELVLNYTLFNANSVSVLALVISIILLTLMYSTKLSLMLVRGNNKNSMQISTELAESLPWLVLNMFTILSSLLMKINLTENVLMSNTYVYISSTIMLFTPVSLQIQLKSLNLFFMKLSSTTIYFNKTFYLMYFMHACKTVEVMHMNNLFTSLNKTILFFVPVLGMLW